MISEALMKEDLVRQAGYLETCLEEYVDLITEITRVPAPSNQEELRTRLVKDKMESMGFPVVRVDEVGNVLGFFPGEDGSRVIVSMAHIDTVFPMDTDLTVRREGNILAAPGVSDNSASVACMLLLGKVFKPPPLPHPVVLVATVGEKVWGIQEEPGIFAIMWKTMILTGSGLNRKANISQHRRRHATNHKPGCGKPAA